jgi:type IV pilus assembly protein PilV
VRLRLCLVGGFTLIEVLVAVFVLAVGIVGAAATQVAALRTRQQSSLMSNAVQLASALADRMRANAGPMHAGDADNPYLGLRYDAALDGAPPRAAALCYAGTGCSSAQLAKFDVYELKQALHADFPGGRVLVCRDARMWDAGRSALSWDCTGAAGAPIVIKLGWRGKEHDGSDATDRAGQFAPSVAIVLPGAFE